MSVYYFMITSHFVIEVKPQVCVSVVVVELRKDNCRSAPPGSRDDVDDIMGSLSIISLRTPSRAHTAPTIHTQSNSGKYTSIENVECKMHNIL